MRVLILGGTTEASALARAVAGDARIESTLSLAGRTQAPLVQPVPMRVGGFGGSVGLTNYLIEQRIDAIIDATHPFAPRITNNAIAAARGAGIPLLALLRPAWSAQPGDHWRVVPNITAAAHALGRSPSRVLLTVGRQDLAPFLPMTWHHFVLRSIEPAPPRLVPPGAEILLARGPFREDEERALLVDRRIDVIVTKNAGGDATRAKLDAARALRLPVIMVARPPRPDCEIVETVNEAMAWLDRHAGSPRGA